MMDHTPERREFVSGAELAPAFAAWTAEWLAAAIDARGMALLVVSGGSTPKRYFHALSAHPLAQPENHMLLVQVGSRRRRYPPEYATSSFVHAIRSIFRNVPSYSRV